MNLMFLCLIPSVVSALWIHLLYAAPIWGSSTEEKLWQCFFPQYLLSQIETPLFIVNGAYDWWQVHLPTPISDPPVILHSINFDSYINCWHKLSDDLFWTPFLVGQHRSPRPSRWVGHLQERCYHLHKEAIEDHRRYIYIKNFKVLQWINIISK